MERITASERERDREASNVPFSLRKKGEQGKEKERLSKSNGFCNAGTHMPTKGRLVQGRDKKKSPRGWS